MTGSRKPGQVRLALSQFLQRGLVPSQRMRLLTHALHPELRGPTISSQVYVVYGNGEVSEGSLRSRRDASFDGR